jgi:hypothetical protein
VISELESPAPHPLLSVCIRQSSPKWLSTWLSNAIVARHRGFGHLRRSSESPLPRRLGDDHPTDVYIPRVVIDALQHHKAVQTQERLLAGTRWHETGLVFTSTIGTPIEVGNLRRQFWKLLDKAGLPRMRFHDLRHSCASLLLVQGVPARVVMETLGHSNISITMDTYTHALPELQRQAADAMDRALGDRSLERWTPVSRRKFQNWGGTRRRFEPSSGLRHGAGYPTDSPRAHRRSQVSRSTPVGSKCCAS